MIWHPDPEPGIPRIWLGQAHKQEEESKKRDVIAAPKHSQAWLSPIRTRQGAATQVLHVFIKKTADGEESIQKPVWPGPFAYSSPVPPLAADPRWVW